MGLGAASLVYSGIRGGSNPEITDFKVNKSINLIDLIIIKLKVNEIINDLTRDQTAAQNIVNTLGVVSDLILLYSEWWRQIT